MCNKDKLVKLLRYALDENEFFSPYGIRSLSAVHREHPCSLHVGGGDYSVHTCRAESNNGSNGAIPLLIH